MPTKHLLLSSIIIAGGTTQALNAAELETITVTAKRKAQNSLDLASNISVLDAKQISDSQAVHFNQLASASAGTWISRGNGQESLTALRSPVLTGPASCGAFVFAQDNIPLRGQGFCNANQLFDSFFQQAKQIEIVRGPNSASFGSNALHGVINVLSADVGKTGSYVNAGIGPDDYQSLSFSRDSKDEQGWLVQGIATHDNGFKNDSGYGQQKLLLKHQSKTADKTSVTAINLHNLNQETAGFITGFEAYRDDNAKDDNNNPEAFRDASSFSAYHKIDKALASGAHFVFTPYVRSNTMRFAQHWLTWAPIEENDHTSLGLQTSLQNGQGSNYRWTTGFDIEYTRGSLREYQTNPTSTSGFTGEVRPQGEHYDYRVDALVFSSFAQTEIDVSTNGQVHTGMRLEHTQYDYDNRLSTGSACEPSVAVDDCRYFRPADRKHKFDDFSFDIAYLYKLSEQNSLWAKAAHGFRAPETTELFRLQRGQNNTSFDSEQIQGVELGWRHQSAKWQFELAAYWQQKDDVIVQDSATKSILGQGQTEHKGIELSSRYQINPKLTWSGVFSVAKHIYSSDLLITSNNIKGNEIDTAPRQMAQTQLSWQVSEPLAIDLEAIYLGRYYLDAENLHSYDGHKLANLRLRYHVTPKVKLALAVYNLADRDYAERADFGFGSYRYFVGQGRSTYLNLSYTF